jgi:hypothetical protein
VYSREAESGLLYFHFARLLGSGAIVYPATYRTVAVDSIDTWSARAIATPIMEKKTPRGGWRRLRWLLGWIDKDLSPRLQNVRKQLLVPGADDQVMGSLDTTCASIPRGPRTTRRSFKTWFTPVISPIC